MSGPFAFGFTLLAASGGFLVFCYFLWLLYLALAVLAQAKSEGRLTPTGYKLGWPIYCLGLFLDVLVNWTLFSLLVVDLPREYTITEHLNRILTERGPGWRRSVAVWMCTHLLNPFDYTGRHCIACGELLDDTAAAPGAPEGAP